MMKTLTPDIEQTIIHYYPQRALVSPLENESITWDFDSGYDRLKALLADLERLDPKLRPGTRGGYDISEEVVLFDDFRLQLSYIGPYAALNYGLDRDLDEDGREHARGIERLLERHGFLTLESPALETPVAWIQHGTQTGRATVWDCLFVHPEA